MTQIPEIFWKEFDTRKGPCILGTVDDDGTPNLIYVGVLRRESDDRIAIVDSAFCKTRENLLQGSPVSFLFITEEGKAYQAKCEADYSDDTELLAEAKTWAPPIYEPKAVLRLGIESIYCGAQEISAPLSAGV